MFSLFWASKALVDVLCAARDAKKRMNQAFVGTTSDHRRAPLLAHLSFAG
jgi:hypothetical protein